MKGLSRVKGCEGFSGYFRQMKLSISFKQKYQKPFTTLHTPPTLHTPKSNFMTLTHTVRAYERYTVRGRERMSVTLSERMSDRAREILPGQEIVKLNWAFLEI